MRHDCVLGAERGGLLDLRGAGWARAPQDILPVFIHSVRGIADEKDACKHAILRLQSPFFLQLTSHYCVFPWALPVLEPSAGYGQKSALVELGWVNLGPL